METLLLERASKVDVSFSPKGITIKIGGKTHDITKGAFKIWNDIRIADDWWAQHGKAKKTGPLGTYK